jgi:type VI secretion system protein ImpC
VLVDRDTVDQVLARMAPHLRIALPNGREVMVGFRELDDFHPDRLYARLPVFAPFRTLREELSDPARFAQMGHHPPTSAPAAPAPQPPSDLLDRIIEQPAPESEDLHGFIQRAVAPYLLPEASAQQKALLGQVDAAIGALLRLVLHHPDFQALESLWRSMNLVVRRVETSADLQIHLFDVQRAELEADLLVSERVEETSLYRALVGMPAASGEREPWSLLVGAYTFGQGADDVSLLARIARTANAIGAPWISGAHPRLVGCEGVGQLADPRCWTSPDPSEQAILRRSAHARWLGLALPRVLLRLPYGRDGEECEQAPAFEELTEPLDHEEFLWGNPAIACALLLAQSVEAAGWALRPGMHRELTGLPLHLRRREGEAEATPCAEVLLTEGSTQRLLDEGLMPLASVKGQDAIRLIRFQSVADPLAPLAGAWQGGTE